MKTDKTRQLLEQAIRSLPPDNALSDVRNYMVYAFRKLNEVEKKRSKRESITPHQQWKYDLQTNSLINPLSPSQQTDILSKIDHMINYEKTRIDEIRNRSQKPDEATLRRLGNDGDSSDSGDDTLLD